MGAATAAAVVNGAARAGSRTNSQPHLTAPSGHTAPPTLQRPDVCGGWPCRSRAVGQLAAHDAWWVAASAAGRVRARHAAPRWRARGAAGVRTRPPGLSARVADGADPPLDEAAIRQWRGGVDGQPRLATNRPAGVAVEAAPPTAAATRALTVCEAARAQGAIRGGRTVAGRPFEKRRCRNNHRLQGMWKGGVGSTVSVAEVRLAAQQAAVAGCRVSTPPAPDPR